MSTSTVNVTLNADQAKDLIAIVDGENTATKNLLVTAVIGNHTDTARSLAERSRELTALRAAVARAMH
jgi:aerobic-type carbon monoxide dehydrogenase small subunit (CoxS/CutS family)